VIFSGKVRNVPRDHWPPQLSQENVVLINSILNDKPKPEHGKGCPISTVTTSTKGTTIAWNGASY